MSEEIELRHLRYFLAVAETLHFTRAAEKLGMAQPPLSQQIKRLEELLGHALFERTTRGVKLTLAGQLLVERAKGTLEKVQDDLEQVRRLGRGEEGTLTVGFPGSVMFTAMPAAIQSFRVRYPRVELRLREMNTSILIAGLLDGTLDVALLRDGDATEGIALKEVLRERYVAVLPEGHKLARARGFRLGDWRRSRFCCSQGGWGRWRMTGRLRAANGLGFGRGLCRMYRSGLRRYGWWRRGWGCRWHRSVCGRWGCRGWCIGW